MTDLIPTYKLIDNTNVTDCHREVSREFGRGATSVIIKIKINGREAKTEVLMSQNVFDVFKHLIDIEKYLTGCENVELEYVSCESDAAEWEKLFQ